MLKRCTRPWCLLLTILISFIVCRVASGQIEGSTWSPIGPEPLDHVFFGEVSGRASALAVNPENPDDIWLGTAAGGVWHSLNDGVDWEPTSDKEASLAIGALALDDCTSEGCATVYAGTGENAIRRDTYYGVGLLVGMVAPNGQPDTVDWVLRTGSPYDFRFSSIQDVVLDPTTSGADKRLFITVSSGVTVSATEATVTAPEPDGGYGIYRSEDQGLTWEKLTVAGADGARPTDLEMHPEKSEILYAGFLGRGVFKSTDGGDTWCPLDKGIKKPKGCPGQGLPDVGEAPFDHVEIALAPSDPRTLYVTLGMCPDRLLQSCSVALYRSDNDGKAWSLVGDGTPVGSEDQPVAAYSRYTHGLAIDPGDEETILLAGLELWRSGNGGEVFGPAESKIHPDIHEIVFHPSGNGRAYATTDGGIVTSSDGGKTWTQRNRTLQITGFQGLASSPRTTVVLAGAQDNGCMAWNGEPVWESVGICGDGGITAIDLDDETLLYRGTNQGAVILGGVGIGSPITNDPELKMEPRMFYARFVQDPSATAGGQHAIYYGTHRLWRSLTDGGSWEPASPVHDAGPEPEIITAGSLPEHLENLQDGGGRDVVTAIAVAPSDPGRVYVGYYGGEVFRFDEVPCTSVDLPCASRIDSDLPDQPVTEIAVDPDEPDTAYLTLSGFGTFPHVWKTEDGGDHWEEWAEGLPDGVPADTVSIEPTSPRRVYVGMDSGPEGESLFRRVEGDDSWVPFADGLPNAPVFGISIDEAHDRIFAATHGRGAFVLGSAFVSTFEGWVDDKIWDVAVYGHNFPRDAECTVRLLQSNGEECGAGDVDVAGGRILTDENGKLVTSLQAFWEGKRVVWPCLHGRCIGGGTIEDCNDDADGNGTPDLLSTVEVECGGEKVSSTVVGCPPLEDPPSSVLGLGAPSPGGAGPGGYFERTLDLVASVQRRTGTESLCTVSVPYGPAESPEAVLSRAQEMIAADTSCLAAGVDGIFDSREPGPDEDDFGRPPTLRLSAPGITGGQLITGTHLKPGDAAGRCFSVEGLGLSALNQMRIVKVEFQTLPGGAVGGEVSVKERTPVGTCTATIPTSSGESAQLLASRFEAVFRGAINLPVVSASEVPVLDCPPERNALGVLAQDASLVFVSARGLEVCVDDPGVGFTLGPEELRNSHPVASAGDDRTVRLQGAGPVTVRLDGRRSSDPDSTPGTHDDIAEFHWFRVGSDGSRIAVGRAEVQETTLDVGTFEFVLRVVDRQGLSDEDTVRLTLLPPDCNANGIDDALDISSGSSEDVNFDGIPDECEVRRLLWELYGVAQGGGVEVTLKGFGATCTVSLATSPGETAEQVVANLASAINADLCMQGEGISASGDGHLLTLSGFLLEHVSTSVTDQGIRHRVPILSIPTLGPCALLALGILLAAGGLRFLLRSS